MVMPWHRTDWTVEDWIDYAWQIDRRRCGRPRVEAARRHIARFPADRLRVEIDRNVLDALLNMILNCHPNTFGRPSRGYRAGHWTTPVVMDANNQLFKLNRIGQSNSWAA